MELKDLVGPHEMLQAARPGINHPFDGSKDGIAFCLDDKVYLAFEDDNDGYRSCMGALFVADAEAYNLWSPDYIRRKVVCRHLTQNNDKYDTSPCDILEVIDVENGHCWLRVGTENIDDYYPSFIAVWTPMPPAEHAEPADTTRTAR
jgi:hypothetical protein